MRDVCGAGCVCVGCYRPTLKIFIRQKSVLFDKSQLVLHMYFLIIQENEAENEFMMLDELCQSDKLNVGYNSSFNWWILT